VSLFAPTKPAALAAEQLKEARMKLLEHEAAAEFNQAMSRMLRERIARLEAYSTTTTESEK